MVWRGTKYPKLRGPLVDLSEKHPDLIDAKFSNPNKNHENFVSLEDAVLNYSYFIDNLKNHGLSFDQISNHEFEHYSNGKLSEIYELYQKRLQVFNSVDFGDLILQPVNLLKKNFELLEHYQERFKYILVDEYQDTNTSQYFLLRLLAEKNKNICCVGDDDQSIYSWRGAEIKNFLEFDQVYNNTKVIRLEQNYRSSQNILSVQQSIFLSKFQFFQRLATSNPVKSK